MRIDSVKAAQSAAVQWGREHDGDGQSGRGLLIIGEVASRWGRDEGGAGRTVWFEIDW